VDAVRRPGARLDPHNRRDIQGYRMGERAAVRKAIAQELA